jgi:hypothetical protein
MSCLLALAKKSKQSLLSKTINTYNKPNKKPKDWKPLSKTATYKWLNRLGFHVTKEKKRVYIDSHKRENVINYC